MATALLGYNGKRGGGSTIIKGPLPSIGKKNVYYFVPIDDTEDTKYDVYIYDESTTEFKFISHQEKIDLNDTI